MIFLYELIMAYPLVSERNTLVAARKHPAHHNTADIRISHTFADRFIESGAYYTLKQMVMFEGLSLGGNDVVENLEQMKERGRNGYMRLYRTLNV